MNLCNDGHGEVCYEGRLCPACEKLDDKDAQMDNLKQKVIALEESLEEKTQELNEAYNQVADLERRLGLEDYNG